MSNVDHLDQERAQAEEQWLRLTEEVRRLEDSYERETREDEKIRLEPVIADRIRLRDATARNMKAAALQQRARQLEEDALALERKRSYKALQRWRELAALGTPGFNAEAHISRLEGELAQRRRRDDLILRFFSRQAEVPEVAEGVFNTLGKEQDADVGLHEKLLERFLSGASSAEEFTQRWRMLSAAPLALPTLNFHKLYRRLAQGHIALFLGAELPRHFDATLPDARQMAERLASEMELADAPGTLSAVAEYVQMAPDHGPDSLVRGLHRLLPTTQQNPLYGLLGRIPEPLLIIYAGHDRLLEQTFDAMGKRHVTISSVVSSHPDLPLGKTLLKYSDRAAPEEALFSEHLSEKPLMDQGYTIVFKLRGTCPPLPAPREMSSLILSEDSHFSFARHQEKLLPPYVVRQLATRGLWFLGFEPRHWEDRLFARAILDCRSNPNEKPDVIRDGVQDFEARYWDSKNVRRHMIGLRHFVAALQEASR